MAAINTTIKLNDIINYIKRRRADIDRLQKAGKTKIADLLFKELSGAKTMAYILANPYSPLDEEKEWDEAYELLKEIIEK